MGSDGILLSNEIYLYIFDAALMALTMILFNLRHPALIIMGRRDLEREEAAGSDVQLRMEDREVHRNEYKH